MILRALEPEDIDVIYAWENDPEVWNCGVAHAPFSRYQLTQYIMNASTGDVFADKQLRLIGEVEGCAVGCVDLYDFDPVHHRAAIGILVDSKQRRQGYAKQLLVELIKYAQLQLQLHQLYCMVACNNEASENTFRSVGFESCGKIQDWVYDAQSKCYSDAWIMQYMIK